MVKCFLICIIYIQWTFVYVAMKLIGTGASWASAPYQRIACMVLYCMELSATAGWPPDCPLFLCSLLMALQSAVMSKFTYCSWSWLLPAAAGRWPVTTAAGDWYLTTCCWILDGHDRLMPADNLCFWHECWLLAYVFVYSTQVHVTVADVDWYWPAAWYFEKRRKI